MKHEMRERKILRQLHKDERKEEYIEALHELAEDKTVPAAVRMSAIVHILDREVGKPGLETDGGGGAGTTIIVRGGLPTK